MKTQLDEKQNLMRKIESISSADEIQKLKIFITGMEVGKAVKEVEREMRKNEIKRTRLR